MNVEDLLQGLEAHELKELRDLLNEGEYARIIDDWEEAFNELNEEY